MSLHVSPLAVAQNFEQPGEPGAPAPARKLPDAPKPAVPMPLHIGPVNGLTVSWHEVPGIESWIPAGTLVEFHQVAPQDAHVEWIGAVEVGRDATGRFAQCLMDKPGRYEVITQVSMGPDEGCTNRCRLRAVNYTADKILVLQNPRFKVDVPFLGEWSTNMETMAAFFGDPISKIHRIGKSHYVVSTRQRIDLDAFVFPSGFAPLVEWRVNGTGRALGSSSSIVFPEPGIHSISVGPLVGAATALIETYDVAIEGPGEPGNPIPQGEEITFVAHTSPPGYEKYVSWLSSTKYGSAAPVVGSGALFTTRFDDTYGIMPDGSLGQWLGVKADYSPRGQDQKACVPFFGFDHCPVGNAILVDEGVSLLVDNIGSTGTDGVEIFFGSLAAAAYSFGHLSEFSLFSLANTEAIVHLGMQGRLDGLASPLGVASIETRPSMLRTLAASYDVRGCPLVVVQVFVGGALQGTFTRPAGDVATLSGAQAIFAVGQSEGAFEIDFGTIVQFTPTNPPGPPLAGNRVRLEPSGCLLSNRGGNAVECFEITSGNVGGMKRVTETFIQP